MYLIYLKKIVEIHVTCCVCITLFWNIMDVLGQYRLKNRLYFGIYSLLKKIIAALIYTIKTYSVNIV